MVWKLLRKGCNVLKRMKLSFLSKYIFEAVMLLQYQVLSRRWHISGQDSIPFEDRENVCKNVTFLYKSFERQKKAIRLFKSIQHYYPGAKVVIADDSRIPLEHEDENLKIIHMPFNSGLSAGLNLAISEVKTPFMMRLDDDLLLTPYSKISEQLAFLQSHSQVDIAAIQMSTAPELKAPEVCAVEYIKQPMDDAPNKLLIPHMTQLDKTHYVVGKSPNVFVARTDKIREIGYDDHIRMIDHNEFFYRAAGKLVAVMDVSAWTYHSHNRYDRNYTVFRTDYQGDLQYIREKQNHID